MATVNVTHFSDPNCPFAWSAEPQIRRLQWRYGSQLHWTTRMVGLSTSREEYRAKGATTSMLQASYAHLEAQVGMPFDLSERSALPATLPACREVVAVREHGGNDLADALLRQLRIQGMVEANVIDELHTLRNASHAAGIDSDALDRWAAAPQTDAALVADMNAARHPAASALQLSHKLARWQGGWRYTCPSLELDSGGRSATVAGFVPAMAYDVAFANLAPELERADAAKDPLAVLDWAGGPLATAEVAAIMEIDRDAARAALTEAGATEHPAGTDAFWAR